MARPPCMCCKLVATLVLLLANDAAAQDKDKDGWSCIDGFWYENDVRSDWACDGDGSGGKDGKGEGEDNKGGDKEGRCTHSEDPGMSAFPKTCILGPPDGGLRCWWTHVPDAVKANPGVPVPLVIDMHGGGGCASDQARMSGFKELSDELPVGDAFITVWPQGASSLWGTCGADCDAVQQATGAGKDVYSADDVGFLTAMLAYIVQTDDEASPSRGQVDPTRAYATGFSMGCMMAHRLALERSAVLAGFGCHGGMLIGLDSDVGAQRARVALQPMPAYMTGGTEDAWFDAASFDGWAALNGCGNATITTQVDLPACGDCGKGGAPATAELHERVACDASVEVARLELAGGTHELDPRMASYTWAFLSAFARPDARAALGPAPEAAENAPAQSDAADKSGAATAAAAQQSSLALAVVLAACSPWFC